MDRDRAYTLAPYLQQRWVLCVVVVVFVWMKAPFLHYPFYWDESWPYAAAVTNMYHHGISLMPGAIAEELSRGHPLFFHAAGALWMDVFGPSHFAMHCFALFIAVCCLVAVYEAGLRLFNIRVAAMGVVLVATQALFCVQSTFVLPELLVALLGLLSLYFYVRDKYVLTALCLTALFYTKESGLIMGFVLGADAAIGLLSWKDSMRTRLRRLAAVVAPCVLIGTFFVVQKIVSGWYIFPLHSGMIEHSWKSFWYRVRMGCVRDTFHEGMRYWYFVVLLTLSIVAGIKNKQLKYLAILLPATTIYYWVDDMRAGRLLPSVPFFIVFLLTVVVFLYSLRKLGIFSAVQEQFVRLVVVFLVCYLCFSAMNYYINRYMLAAIVPLLLLTAILYDALIAHTHRWLIVPVGLCILVIGFLALRNDYATGDARATIDGMSVQQSIVDYMEGNGLYDKNISSGSFLESEHLMDASTGFLRSGKVFKIVHWDIDKNTDYAIFDNIEPDYRYEQITKDTTYRRACRYEQGNVWAEVYKRR